MDRHPIENIMDSTLCNIRTMIDVNTIIGTPIASGDTTIIPISKLSFGFVSGGGEYSEKCTQKQPQSADEKKDFPFAGGTGAGVSVTPSAFLIVDKECTRLLPISESTIYDRLIDVAPQIFEEIKSIITNSCQGQSSTTPDQASPSEELM